VPLVRPPILRADVRLVLVVAWDLVVRICGLPYAMTALASSVLVAAVLLRLVRSETVMGSRFGRGAVEQLGLMLVAWLGVPYLGEYP